MPLESFFIAVFYLKFVSFLYSIIVSTKPNENKLMIVVFSTTG